MTYDTQYVYVLSLLYMSLANNNILLIKATEMHYFSTLFW